MPVDPDVEFDSLAQRAYMVYTILPDKIDSMAGVWLGKDFSGIGDILDIYCSKEDKKDVLEYLIFMIQIARQTYAEERERQSKLK